MKKIFTLLSFLYFFNLWGQTDQVLFVGNSMTYFNDMPQLFKNIATDKGKTVDVTSYTVGGAGFVDHVNSAALYQTIKSKTFKYVILQPGTGESAGATHPVNITADRGKIIRDSIRKYSPCSKIFLYEIPYGVPSQNDYATYFNVQAKIKDSITKMANLMQVEIIPAGESAKVHYTSSQDLALHGSYNDVHPNLNGSYLVASAVFATIYKQASFPSGYLGGLSQSIAEYYQQISGNTVLTNPAQWLMNLYHINADFSVSENNQQVTFNNNSSNYNSVLWDFGDGTTSSETHPVHQYSASGIYTVTLTVYKDSCTSTIIKTINTTQLGVSEKELVKLKIYPNPTFDFLFYEGDKTLERIEVYDFSGRNIFTKKDMKSSRGKIDLSNFSKGTYLTKFYYSDGTSQTLKIQKK